MKRSRRPFWIVGSVVGIFILLTILIAPSSKNLTGSTFGRNPDGYGAWYQSVQKDGKSIQRWQRPLEELIKTSKGESKTGKFATLLQIYAGKTGDNLDPTVFGLNESQEEWVKLGNTLILLGDAGLVTSADFRTQHESSTGLIQIETAFRLSPKAAAQEKNVKPLLKDSFGAIVWQQSIDKGTVIYAVTPYLGANAYQDSPGNFPFLTKLVTQNGDRFFVDEYLHGFKEKDVIARETAKDWLSYITKTPLLPILLQGFVLLLFLIWAENRRFGIPKTIQAPRTDNSKAYIQALAGVLQKAGSSEFILEVVGHEEQLQLQQKMGLGTTLLDSDTLITAWVEQTGRPAVELQQILSTKTRGRRLSDSELQAWLATLKTIRQQTTV